MTEVNRIKLYNDKHLLSLEFNPVKIAITAGHDNYKSQGAWAGDISENIFWNEFIGDLMPLTTNIDDLELKQFHRPPIYNIGYHAAMRKLHAEIDNWNASIDVELHFNAFNKPATGHEVLHWGKSKGGKYIAEIMDQAFNDNLQNKDRGLKPVGVNQRGAYGLSVGKSKSILTEAFFKNQIHDYVRGGKYRCALLNSYVQFLENVT